MMKTLFRLLCLSLICFHSPLHAIKHRSGKTCKSYTPKLMTISIMDRNGMSETISNADRLAQYQTVNFCASQPYKKVLRIYSRDPQGNIRAYIHSYHENGQSKQYIEVVNSRAYGAYIEWHENGNRKLQATVIGGDADIDPASEASWLFDGPATAWNEEGALVACINYNKGKLEGDSFYYHPNGATWKRIPFKDNDINGVLEIFLSNGQLMENMEFHNGERQGQGSHYWSTGRIASQEVFENGILVSGKYSDQNGELISEVVEGHGKRAIFGKTSIAELHEYRYGVPEGEVEVFASDNKHIRKYHVKNGQKNGEEIEYYDLPHLRHQPKLAVSWFEGKIQGVVKTWYDNGVLESKREMSNNAKNGLLTAWFRDGYLMLIEEYELDKLVKGEYFRKGEKAPLSIVRDGKGIVTIFDPEGNFVKKIKYEHGIPSGTE